MPLPPGYLEGVRRVREHGALYISDEVICGFGRLGHWFEPSTTTSSPTWSPARHDIGLCTAWWGDLQRSSSGCSRPIWAGSCRTASPTPGIRLRVRQLSPASRSPRRKGCSNGLRYSVSGCGRVAVAGRRWLVRWLAGPGSCGHSSPTTIRHRSMCATRFLSRKRSSGRWLAWPRVLSADGHDGRQVDQVVDAVAAVV